MGGSRSDPTEAGQCPEKNPMPPELTLRGPDDGGLCRLDDQSALELSLEILEAEAASFALRFIQDSEVHRDYLTAIKRRSEESLAAVSRGEISPDEAMLHNLTMLDEILRFCRRPTRPWSRSESTRGHSIHPGVPPAPPASWPGLGRF